MSNGSFILKPILLFVVLSIYTINLTSQELTGDLNNDGCITSTDLSLLISNFGICVEIPDSVIEPSVPLDIIPQINWIYQDVYTEFVTLEVHHIINPNGLESPNFDDIQDSVMTTWSINSQVIQNGTELDITQALDSGVICDGIFPLTIRLEYQGYFYERTYNAQVNFALETDVPFCTFTDAQGIPLTVTTFKEAYYVFEEYEFCINCN